MKTTIRQDAHVPWLPKPDLTRIIPVPSCIEGFRLPREDRMYPVHEAKPSAEREFIDGWKRRATLAAKPHPWAERRKDVIEQFPNVRESVTPIGYEDAWDDEMEFRSPEDEWKYIEATQDNELAPEWLSFRANGIRGESLDRLVESEDGDYSMGDLVTYDEVNRMEDYEHAYELLGGMRRIEAFLKAEDEQKWFTGRTRRYAWAVNEAGKRGLLRLNRSTSDKQFARDWDEAKSRMPSVEYIERAMDHRDQYFSMEMDQQGRQRRVVAPDCFSTRDDLREKAMYRTLNEMEAGRVEVDTLGEVEDDHYLPNTPCPNPKCEERGDDCVVCLGDGYILHTLGVDGEMDSTYGTWRIEKRARPRYSRSLRASLSRLDADISAANRSRS